MNGDCAPLAEIVDFCEKNKVELIVDEAHATGIFGERGEGLVVENGLENKVFARVITFGKAIGAHGAIVLGSPLLKKYLINFCRSFIYTTAPSKISLMCIKTSYDKLIKNNHKTIHINKLINLFKQLVKQDFPYQLIESKSAIQCIVVPGNDTVKQLANFIFSLGFDVRPILYPTVKYGEERIRICLHTFNTEEEIRQLILAFKQANE